MMKKTFKQFLLGSLLGAASIATAHAGLLTYQGVTFTSAWSGNVLTLEIDAATLNGDWTKAKGLAALELNGIGNYTGVRVTTAPGGATDWTTSSAELNASGCSGDANGQAGSRLCFFGQQIALADNMVFSFSFSGNDIRAVDPHVKVEFVNAKGRKVGSLLSQTLPASPKTGTGTGSTTGTATGTAPLIEIPAKEILPSAALPPAVPPSGVEAPLQAGSEAGNGASQAAVPEPQSIALLLGGLGLMGLFTGRKRRS